MCSPCELSAIFTDVDPGLSEQLNNITKRANKLTVTDFNDYHRHIERVARI